MSPPCELARRASESLLVGVGVVCGFWQTWTNDASGEAVAGTIGTPNGVCQHAGQIQLGAMALSDSGAPQVTAFQTSLNHSVIYTLRITSQERGAVYELLQADGVTTIERVTHTHRFCYNSALGRNMGLSRLPLGTETALDATCTLQTPIELCYGSDPMTWGTNGAWRRNSASHAPLPSNLNPLESPLATRGTDEGVNCQIPFCTPSD